MTMTPDAKLEVVLTARDAATQTIDRASAAIKSQLTSLEQRAAQFTRNWLQVTAAIYGAGKAWDEVKLGARAQQERQAFENMAASYGQNADHIIRKLQEASAGTIDTMTLINKAGTAMMMGIAPEKLDRLMQIARATARMTGQEVTTAFADITKGVARSSKMTLDNLGIIVSVDQANQAYARTLHTTADKLTDVERKTAFLNAAIAEGDKLVRRLGDTHRKTTAEMFQSWEAMAQNVRVTLQYGIVESVKYVVMAFSLAGSTINQVFEQIAQGWAYIFSYLGTLPGGELLGFKALGESLDAIAAQFRGARSAAYGFVNDILNLKQPTPIMPMVRVPGDNSGGGAKDDASEYNRLLREADRLQKEAIESLKVLQTQATDTWSISNEWIERNNQAERDAIALAKKWNEEAVQSITTNYPNMAERLEQALGDPDAYFGRIGDSAKSFGDDLRAAITGWASGFSKSLSDLVWDAETSFADIAESFGRMLTQMAMQRLVVSPFLDWFGGLFPSAKGNVFHNGDPVPFGAGGIINRPTVFPMRSGGIGLAGEAGDEAIFPITRLPGGDLGIKGSGSGQPHVTVVVNNNTGREARVRQERPKWNGQEWVIGVWLDAYERNMSGLRDAMGR